MCGGKIRSFLKGPAFLGDFQDSCFLGGNSRVNFHPPQSSSILSANCKPCKPCKPCKLNLQTLQTWFAKLANLIYKRCKVGLQTLQTWFAKFANLIDKPYKLGLQTFQSKLSFKISPA